MTTIRGRAGACRKPPHGCCQWAFLVAGDLCELDGVLMGRTDHSVGALTEAHLVLALTLCSGEHNASLEAEARMDSTLDAAHTLHDPTIGRPTSWNPAPPVLLRALSVAAVLAPLLGVASPPSPARAEPLRLYAAGSLTAAFDALLTAFGTPPGDAAQATYGPSGLLRERLEKGEPADVFASADMGQPRRLAEAGRGTPVVLFARNRMCALGRERLGLTQANLLDRLLEPAVKLATSTPLADPGGDYAWAVFARAEQVRPGAKAVLEGKAQQLVGGPSMAPLVPGQGASEGVFLSGRADVMLGYCSGAAGLRRTIPDMAAVPLPPELEVGPAYGLTVLSGNPAAARFALFVLSEPGQAILARQGFIPVALPTPVQPGGRP